MPLQPMGFDSQHWVHYDAGGGKAYVLTGVVLATMQGGEEDYSHEELEFGVLVPELPPGLRYRLRYWAPFVTLNSISSESGAVNPAWAVDGWSLLFPDVPIAANDHLHIRCHLAVRGAGVFVLRVGYVINLFGHLEAIPGFPH